MLLLFKKIKNKEISTSYLLLLVASPVRTINAPNARYAKGVPVDCMGTVLALISAFSLAICTFTLTYSGVAGSYWSSDLLVAVKITRLPAASAVGVT